MAAVRRFHCGYFTIGICPDSFSNLTELKEVSFPGGGRGFCSPLRARGMDTSDGWCNAPPTFSFSCQKKKQRGPRKIFRFCGERRKERSRAESSPSGGDGVGGVSSDDGPCMVQKRKRSTAPAGGRGTWGAEELLPSGTQVFSPRRGAGGGLGGYRMDQLLFSLPLIW